MAHPQRRRARSNARDKVVGNVLVVSGVKAETGESYIINAEYSLDGDQLD